MKSSGQIIILSIFLFLITGPLHSDPVIQQVVNNFNSLDSFRANITFDRGGSTSSGVLSYSHGKVNLKMSDGRVVAADGQKLVIYSPATSTAGKQDINPGTGGLGWILHGFNSKVNGNSALLKATNPSARIQEVRLRWSSDKMLRSLSIKSRNSDSWYTISLTGIRQVSGFPASMFSYRAPAGGRTVENPLNISN